MTKEHLFNLIFFPTEKSRWIIEPSDQTELVVGSTAWIDCSATGYPQPVIVWKRAQS